MRNQSYCLRTGFAVSAFALFSAFTASAANGTWNGTQNGSWTNIANWSASPYPFGPDIALFANAGNGQTALDLSGLPSIKFIVYDSPSVAAYTNGTGAANSQTLIMADSGEFKLSSTAGSSQVFNCGVQLGTDRSQQSYYFRNDNPLQSLIFNNVIGCPLEVSGVGYAGAKTLVINGKGNVAILGDLKAGGATSLTLTDLNSGALTLAGSNTVYVLNMNGGAGSVINIADKELFLNNAGGNVLNCTLGGTINGPGKLRLSTVDGYSSAGYNYADLNVNPNMTLVINAGITGQGGLESNTGTGTFVLNGTNTFEGHMNLSVGAFSVSRIGNRGSLTSNCGQGTNLYFNGGKLIYTGTGETTDRQIVMNNNPTIDQSGPSGTLRFATAPILINAGRTLNLQGNTAGVGEFSAPLTNTFGNTLAVNKYGAGTWIFSATNTYTGATTVYGGKLLVNSPGRSSGSTVTVNSGGLLGGNSTVAGNVTVAAGGMLAAGDVNSVGTLSLGGTLSLTSSTLFFDVSTLDTPNVVTDKVSVVGALTLAGTNTIVLSFSNGFAPIGTNTLMTFASRTGTGSFVLSPAYANAFLITNATSVKLAVTNSGTYGLLWKGTASGNWDGTDLNWTNGSAAVAYPAGEAATFDDTASAFTVGSANPVYPSTVLFNNSASNYTVSATIGGTGMVYKLGSGAVSLTGNNTYTGQTTVAAGTLTIGGSGLLGGGNYATNLVDNGLLNYASSVAQTNSGVIFGGGDLLASGSGTLTLMGNNTYYGMTTVTGGVLRIQNANALGGTTFGTVVAAGAALEVAGGITFAAETLDLRGTLSSQTGTNTYAGIIWPQDGSSFDVGSGSLLIVSSVTANTGTNAFFSKTGAGTLRFTGDPNPVGTFTVAGGIVELQQSSGNTDCPIFINPGAMLREITAGNLGDYFIQADGTLDMQGTDQFGGLGGSGLVTNGSASAVTVTVGGNNQSGVFSGVIRNGAGTLSVAKTGSGVQTLSGTNTYSGGTTLSGGQLNINYGGASGTSSAIGTGTFTIGGAYAIDNTSGSDVTLSPVIPQNWNGDFTYLGSKSLNLGSGAVTLGANRTVTVLTNTLTVGGAVGGAYSLTKNGGGTLTLNGANTFSGATTVNGGTLLINGSTVAGSAVTVYSGILGGSGTISGTVAVAAGSIVAPGGVGAIGTLTLPNTTTNVLTLTADTLLFDLSNVAGTCDKIAITNAAGKLVLNLSLIHI